MEKRGSTTLIETLVSRGWCFRDVHELEVLIQTHIATVGELRASSPDSIESQLLLNLDLKSIGGKSLPIVPKKSSHLPGPKVLQIVSVKDIYKSSIEASSGSSHSRRLLRLRLTDGHTEIIAVEYSPIPSIADDIVPGTKVRVENKAPICSGILCLNAKVITVLGGVVQSLYEEWQISRKYSSLSNSSLRPTNRNEGEGPPPFEKLQIGGTSQRSAPNHSLELTSKASFVKSGGKDDSRDMGKNKGLKVENVDIDTKAASSSEKMEEKPGSLDSRPKEVTEAVPVQNQAAAQKLLQKMSQPNRDGRHARGPKYRGKGKHDEQPVFTLEEWEKRKGEVKSVRVSAQDISNDEKIARQLQEQLDMEDVQARMVHESEAEKIRTSMFTFERVEEDRHWGRSGFRERGRGRGRGRGRRGFG